MGSSPPALPLCRHHPPPPAARQRALLVLLAVGSAPAATQAAHAGWCWAWSLRWQRRWPARGRRCWVGRLYVGMCRSSSRSGGGRPAGAQTCMVHANTWAQGRSCSWAGVVGLLSARAASLHHFCGPGEVTAPPADAPRPTCWPLGTAITGCSPGGRRCGALACHHHHAAATPAWLRAVPRAGVGRAAAGACRQPEGLLAVPAATGAAQGPGWAASRLLRGRHEGVC
jgi:hypothetical protein